MTQRLRLYYVAATVSPSEPAFVLSHPEWNIDPSLQWAAVQFLILTLRQNSPSPCLIPATERGGSSGAHICPAQQPNCDSSNNWRELSANGSGAATCIDQSQQADNTGGQRHETHIEAMKMKIYKTLIILMLAR